MQLHAKLDMCNCLEFTSAQKRHLRKRGLLACCRLKSCFIYSLQVQMVCTDGHLCRFIDVHKMVEVDHSEGGSALLLCFCRIVLTRKSQAGGQSCCAAKKQAILSG